MDDTGQVARHYDTDGLTVRIAAAIDAAGMAGRLLSVADLAPLDQFHTRGLQATMALADTAGIAREDRVLDVGSGLGGPSRYLAGTFGCAVQGIDLSPAFVAAATFLAERTGLAGHVRYQAADALSLPFDDGSFDVVWTQHVAMNIRDRDGLYAEMRRVLRPGGRLAVFDVVAGPGGPIRFPVPWSRGPDTSFLLDPIAMRAALERHGFQVASWADTTDEAVAWFRQQQQASRPAPGTLGLPLVMGPDFPAMAANLGRNLAENRAGLVQAVLTRA